MKNGVLAVSLPQRGAVPAATYELLTVGRRMAEALKQPLCVALFGSPQQAQDLVDCGADKVFLYDAPILSQLNDELHAAVLTQLCASEQFSRVLLASSIAGRSVAARLAVTLKAGMASEVSDVEPATDAAKRSYYSGNLIADIQFKATVQVMTVQAMAFARAEKQAGRSGEIVKAPSDPSSIPVKMEFVGFQPDSDAEIDLGSAERVVSGGRGLGNAEGFKLIYELAQTINAAVGASRAVVDSGWIAYKHQVGLTGRAVRPKLYVACGISGQIQHLAGMSSSKNIVAINTDADCPMMQVASVSMQGDLYELIPLIIAEIKKRK